MTQVPNGLRAQAAHVTLVKLVDERGITVSFGTAQCNPADDYDKALGETIATGRALKTLGEPR